MGRTSSGVARRLAALPIALLAAVGCTGDDGSDSTLAPTTAAVTTIVTTTAPATTSASSTAPAQPSTMPATTAPVTAPPTPADPAALLIGALADLGDTYRFDGTITVNGATAATVVGDRVGDGSRFDVTSNGTTVSYVVLPDATWVRQADGAWEELQDPPSTVDPIDALRAPDGVALAGGDAQAAQIDVTVAATALGVAGEAPVVVHATVNAGALVSVAYETVQNGATAQNVTTFGPAQDPSPVVAPA